MEIELPPKILENLKKVQLNPIEIALACKSLMNKLNLTQDDLAKKIGKKRSTVANYLRLLHLPKQIQESIAFGKISIGHAKVLLSLSEAKEQLWLCEQIIQKRLTVKETESLLLKKYSERLPDKNIYVKDLENSLEKRMGTKVAISGNGDVGWVKISFQNLDDLDRILEILGVK